MLHTKNLQRTNRLKRNKKAKSNKLSTKKLRDMKKIILLCMLFLGTVLSYGQYTSSPDVGELTDPISYDQNNTSCGLSFLGDNMLRAKVESINGNAIKIKIIKWNDENQYDYYFADGTKVYVKYNASSNYGTLLCSGFIELERKEAGLYYDGYFEASHTGDMYLSAVSVSTSGIRYYSRRIKISKEEEPCDSPNHNNFEADNITQNSFRADWPSVDNAIKYEINVKRASDANYDNPVYFGASSSSYENITGLESGTTYKYQVRTKCSNGWGEWSPSSSSSFTTLDDNCSFADCNSSDCGNLGNEAYEAIQYLCERNIVTGDNGYVTPDNNITRAQLAKVAYKGLFREEPCIATNFPCPYNDLQETSYYYEYAKALLYLEYDNGISPFNRDFFNFNPNNTIIRAWVLKVLLETFNIPQDTEGASPFNDVSTSDSYYGYVKAAANLGIINTNNNNFRPTDACTRAEAFIMLYRILTQIDYDMPDDNDFFIPGNYTPENLSERRGLDEGNFSHYTKNCFNVANRGIPMDFSFTYNSFPTQLPEVFYPIQPLGYGWTHSYNAYIRVTKNIDDNEKQLLIHWPNGSINVYKILGDDAIAVTKGLYDEVELDFSGNDVDEVKITTKTQITYTFTNESADNLLFLKKIEDRHNNYVKVYYENGANDIPRIDYVKDPFNRELDFYYYSGTNHLKKIKDPLDRVVRFYFDNGKLTGYNDAELQYTTFNYSTKPGEEHLIHTIELPEGNKITNHYKNRKLLSIQHNQQTPIEIKISDNYEEPLASDYVKSEVSTFVNDEIMTTNYRRDAHNRIRFVNNDLVSSNIEYTDTDNPTLPTRIVKNGITTTIHYDDNGNPTQYIVSGTENTIGQYFSYNDDNKINSYVDGNENVYTFDYSNGNLVSVNTPETTIEYEYNDYGQVTKAILPENIVTRYYYDNYGYLKKKKIVGSNIKTEYTYDLIGRLKTVTDAKGNVNTYEYNGNDNIVSVQDPYNNSTHYEYDENENLLKVINAKGYATNLEYNDDDLLEAVSFAGNTKYYEYNTDGRLSKYTKPDGLSFNYEYDDMGRLIDDGSTSYTYDEDKLKEITFNGNSIIFTYDDLNRITDIEYTDMPNNTISYTYDNNNNITSIAYPGNKTVEYTYDDVNRMKSVTDWNNHKTRYYYRTDGLLDKVKYPNNVRTQYIYDEFGRLIQQKTTRDDGTVIAKYDFELDDLGNHTKETLNQPQALLPQLPNGTTNYNYDNGTHLQTAGDATYNFDENGDIENGNGYTYDFDKNGRLTEISGRLNAIYRYDGLGNRRKRNDTRYILDILGMSRVLAETNDNSIQHYYVYGLGLISRIDNNNNTNYYVYDFRGSTVAITDDSYSANITHKYAYDEFGKITAEEEANPNPFKYVGKMGLMYEDENHYFVRARYYDCNTARFISEDPIWNTNLYAYAGNNGVMNVDVNGKEAVLTTLCAYQVFVVIGGAVVVYKMKDHVINIANTLYEGLEYSIGSTVNFVKEQFKTSDEFDYGNRTSVETQASSSQENPPRKFHPKKSIEELINKVRESLNKNINESYKPNNNDPLKYPNRINSTREQIFRVIK